MRQRVDNEWTTASDMSEYVAVQESRMPPGLEYSPCTSLRFDQSVSFQRSPAPRCILRQEAAPPLLPTRLCPRGSSLPGCVPVDNQWTTRVYRMMLWNGSGALMECSRELSLPHQPFSAMIHPLLVCPISLAHLSKHDPFHWNTPNCDVSGDIQGNFCQSVVHALTLTRSYLADSAL